MAKQPRVRAEMDMSEFSANLDSGALEKERRRQQWLRRGVIAMIVLGSCSTLGLVGSWLAQYGAEEPPAAMRLDSPGRAQATVTIEQWLAMTPSPLPAGKLVAWEGVTEQLVEPRDTNELPYTVEVHKFSLASGPNVFDATVPVRVDALGQAAAMGQPQLTPRMPHGDGASSTIWPGYKSMQADGPVSDAITSWAEAFTSGDPARLKLATSDPDTERVYLPLPKAVSVTASTDFSGIPEGTDNTSTLLVRATLQIVWPGQETDSAARSYQPMSYDLLIANANSGSPSVVAWAGAGLGPTLTPYSPGFVGTTRGTGDTGIEDSEESGDEVEQTEQTESPIVAPAPTPTTQQQGSQQGAPTPSSGTTDSEQLFGDMPMPTHDSTGGEG